MRHGWIGVLALVVVPAVTAFGTATYSVTQLPQPIGYGANFAQTVSAVGIAGYAYMGDSTSPILWDGSQATVLPVPGGYQGHVNGINSQGTVVGLVQSGIQQSQPALWRDDQLELLSSPAGLGGVAHAINDAGAVVGTIDSYGMPLEAVMWSGGQMSVLGDFPKDMHASAVSINDGGQVIITANTTSWIWFNGSLTAIPSLGGLVQGSDINNDGTVVGVVALPGSLMAHAFVFEGGSTQLLPELPGDLFTQATAINDAGVIVGDDGTATSRHATLWLNGQNQNLNDLIPNNSGWSLESALNIGNDGTIVGYGTYNGQTSAFELTPNAVPEPASVGVLVVGGVLLLRRRRRGTAYAGQRVNRVEIAKLPRGKVGVSVLLAFIPILAANSLRADVYRWDNGQSIAGTQGLVAGPNIDFSNWNSPQHMLEYADFTNTDVSGASFANSDLHDAWFGTGTGWNKLPGNVSNADFTNAIITYANFGSMTSYGFTSAQLYSTASYKSKDLTDIILEYDDLAGWNFANQNLSSAYLYHADLSGSNLSGTNLANAYLYYAILTNANLSNANLANIEFSKADLTGADFTGANVRTTVLNWSNLSFGQLASTQSYQQKNLTGLHLYGDDVAGWDFSGQNLTSVLFDVGNIQGAIFSNAIVDVTDFSYTDLTFQQLASTRSFGLHDLHGMSLTGDDLTGWNLSNQNLHTSSLNWSTLVHANLSHSDLTDSNLQSALLTGTNLTYAQLNNVSFVDADLSDADLRGAAGFSPDSSTKLHNTIRPDGSISNLALLAGECLTIRNNPVAITVNTSAVFDPLSTIQLYLDSKWTSQVKFDSNIIPDLAGTLDIEVSPTVDPSSIVGQSFELFIWPSSPTSQFDNILTAPGFIWDTSALYTTGVVTLVAVPEPATLSVLGVAGLLLLRRRRRSV